MVERIKKMFLSQPHLAFTMPRASCNARNHIRAPRTMSTHHFNPVCHVDLPHQCIISTYLISNSERFCGVAQSL